MNAEPQSPLGAAAPIRRRSPSQRSVPWQETVAACATAGLATGPRSFTGLAAVVLATPAGARSQPDRVLAHPAAKAAVSLLALQEWVMDKLPATPSRLEPLGLATRLVGAGAAGAILARRLQPTGTADVAAHADGGDDGTAVGPLDPGAADQNEPAVPVGPDWKAIAVGAATSAAVALGVAVVGVRLRGAVASSFGRDWPGAALEDLSSAGLAAAAVYLSTHSRSSQQQ